MSAAASAATSSKRKVESNAGWDYFRQVVLNHTSGRLKVAPEHTSDQVLSLMRKPSFSLFRETKRRFDDICKQAGLRYQLIPYFISSHPGCRLEDMAQLALDMKQMGYRLEQIQDFTPTPMTLSTEMYYTGIDPTTMKPVYVATTPADKADQRRLFFFYRPDQQRDIVASLRRAGLAHFIPRLFPGITESRIYGSKEPWEKITFFLRGNSIVVFFYYLCTLILLFGVYLNHYESMFK